MIFVFLFFLFASFSVFFVSSTLLFCHIYFVIFFNKYLVVQCGNRNCNKKVITILVGYYNFGCHSAEIIRERNLCKLKAFFQSLFDTFAGIL